MIALSPKAHTQLGIASIGGTQMCNMEATGPVIGPTQYSLRHIAKVVTSWTIFVPRYLANNCTKSCKYYSELENDLLGGELR